MTIAETVSADASRDTRKVKSHAISSGEVAEKIGRGPQFYGASAQFGNIMQINSGEYINYVSECRFADFKEAWLPCSFLFDFVSKL